MFQINRNRANKVEQTQQERSLQAYFPLLDKLTPSVAFSAMPPAVACEFSLSPASEASNNLYSEAYFQEFHLLFSRCQLECNVRRKL